MTTARDYLAAVQQRAGAATDGPWEAYDGNEGTDYLPLWSVANDAYHNPSDDQDAPWIAVDVQVGSRTDAKFIAASRTDVPRLVAFALAVLDEMDDCFRSVLMSRSPGEYTIDPRAIRDLADEHLTPKENDS